MKNYNKQILLFSVILILLCFLGTFIFTLPAFIKELDLSGKGNVANSINGLTTPIIGIVTSILLYITLSRQVESNLDQKLKNESDIIFLLLNQIDKELSSFYFKYKKAEIPYKFEGLEGLNEFARDFTQYKFPSFKFTFNSFFEAKQVLLIIRSFELIEKRIEISPVSLELKVLFKNKLSTFFECKLKYALETINATVEKNVKMKDPLTEEISVFLNKRSEFAQAPYEQVGTSNFLQHSRI